MAQLIELSKERYPNIRFLPEGVEVKLMIRGKVVASEPNIIIQVSAVEGRATKQVGRFEELLKIGRRTVREIEHLPKVKPLGNTGI